MFHPEVNILTVRRFGPYVSLPCYIPLGKREETVSVMNYTALVYSVVAFMGNSLGYVKPLEIL